MTPPVLTLSASEMTEFALLISYRNKICVYMPIHP